MAGGPKLWEGMDQGALGQAQQFANQGNWGQAAQAYQQGGGQGFTQPQYQAFTQQYGNVGSPAGQLGGVFGQPGGPYKWTDGPGTWAPPGGQGGVDYYPGETIADGPGSGMWGPPDQPQPIGEFVSDDIWGPPAQAQPIAPPPAQMLPPTPTAPQMPKPGGGPPGTRAITSPNWASYVQGNPDLINAYNQGSPQSIGDWGKSHWELFGQNEGRTVNPYSGLLA